MMTYHDAGKVFKRTNDMLRQVAIHYGAIYTDRTLTHNLGEAWRAKVEANPDAQPSSAVEFLARDYVAHFDQLQEAQANYERNRAAMEADRIARGLTP